MVGQALDRYGAEALEKFIQAGCLTSNEAVVVVEVESLVFGQGCVKTNVPWIVTSAPWWACRAGVRLKATVSDRADNRMKAT